MKRIVILSFIGLIINIGCEKLPFADKFLEKAPGVDITKDSIFKNIDYAERFLWGAYTTLPYGINTARNGRTTKMSHDLMENMTDLAQTNLNWGGVYTLYYSGLYNSAAEGSSADAVKYGYTSEWQWDGIRRSWIFIDNIDRVPGVDPAYVKQLKAEALMIIAVHYADMYRHFGGVPWIGHAYEPDEMTPSMPRMTAQATCDSIVKLCDRAAEDLPFALSSLEELDGRFTRAAAMGLKARILLFNASPLFNSVDPYMDGEASQEYFTWLGSYDVNRWKLAADAAKALIDESEGTGDYAIYHKAGNTFRKDFQEAYYLRGNGEVLISTRVMFRSPTSASWNYTFYWSAQNWGSSCVTDDYVKMFPMSNGKPITDGTSGYSPTNPYINRDPRLYETVVVNGDSYMGRTAELYIGGRERLAASQNKAATGYILRKFLLECNTATSFGSIVHWPYLRLAEIYLSYAEAINEFNDGPTSEAYSCVNIVRNRVGIGDLPAGLSKEDFREAILLERALEFGWEEVRWFDLIRWKKEDVFKKTLHGCDITRTGPPYVYTYTETTQPSRYWKTNFSPKWYLSAFPVNEVQKGYGLVQNPGW